ncbi:MAG: AAA family ATPase [Phycisphaerae bacterium]|nr:AAA family ATPase [Phycisphaerae bacterium]
MKRTTIDDAALQTLAVLVYGDSGIGKTTSLKTLISSSTMEDKVILAVSERSTIPLRGARFHTVLQLEKWPDVQELYSAFLAPDDLEDKELVGAIKRCRVLAIDSLSEISDMCMRHIVEVDRKQLVKERTKGKTETPDNVYADLMTMEDYGLYRNRMLNMISAFCHLPLHFVATCSAGWSKDATGGDTLRTPGLAGKSARECASYFDLVLYMTDQGTGTEPHRVWQTYNSGRVLAKDASGKLGPFEPTDWTALFSKILNDKEAKP